MSLMYSMPSRHSRYQPAPDGRLAGQWITASRSGSFGIYIIRKISIDVGLLARNMAKNHAKLPATEMSAGRGQMWRQK
jgi:hypothetical protein